ncbi:hypothetical protein ACI2JA_03910 [Alkalihalobacillus sp. NPDC078783]
MKKLYNETHKILFNQPLPSFSVDYIYYLYHAFGREPEEDDEVLFVYNGNHQALVRYLGMEKEQKFYNMFRSGELEEKLSELAQLKADLEDDY